MSGESASDRVRRDCRRVAELARSVHIIREHIADYAAALVPESLELPSLDPTCHHLGHGEQTVSFMITLEAVNFGSASFEQLRHRPGEVSGYFTVSRALTSYFRNHGALSAYQLTDITAQQCAEIFDQAGHAPAHPLMQRFAAALKQLGEHLLERYEGSFLSLLESAEGKAARLVELMLGIEHFRDEATYEGDTVRLYKRAQLTAADLSLAFGGQGLGELSGLEELTIFADDLVPHVLRLDGLLHYDRALAAHIDAGQTLASGSAEEVEIRACAVHAAELIVAEFRRTRRYISPMQLDYCLWNRGLAPTYSQRPRHRAVTDFY